MKRIEVLIEVADAYDGSDEQSIEEELKADIENICCYKHTIRAVRVVPPGHWPVSVDNAKSIRTMRNLLVGVVRHANMALTEGDEALGETPETRKA